MKRAVRRMDSDGLLTLLFTKNIPATNAIVRLMKNMIRKKYLILSIKEPGRKIQKSRDLPGNTVTIGRNSMTGICPNFTGSAGVKILSADFIREDKTRCLPICWPGRRQSALMGDRPSWYVR